MRFCRYITGGFAVLWLLAIGVLAIGTFGWFGQEKDPLSGVYLILLGAPWVQFASNAGVSGPVLAILAPAINLAILSLLCRVQSRRSG